MKYFMHSMMLSQNDTIQQDSDNNDKEDNDETKVDKLINETTNTNKLSLSSDQPWGWGLGF